MKTISHKPAETSTNWAADMTYERACEILGFTTPKSLTANAALAESCLKTLNRTSPLRMKVACDVLIKAAK